MSGILRNLASLGTLLLSSTAFATQIFVTTTVDFGPGSLREEIDNAASGDTLVYHMETVGVSEINIDFPITIDKDLTIIGATAGSFALRPANAIDGLFEIENEASVYLQDIYIDNYRNGAIIIESGCSLTMERCRMSYCTSSTGIRGGAIYNNGGTLTLISSSIHNCAADEGAGIYNANGGSLTLMNSNLSNNDANDSGGGIYQVGTNSSTRILYSTIVSNYANGGSGGNGVDIVAGSCEIYNSLFAYNGEGGGEIAGEFTSNGYNLIDDTDGISGSSTWPVTGDLFNIDPEVSNGVSRGGATIVALPYTNTSPIIDAGDPAFSGVEFDNRLAYRVMDGNRDGVARVDIGSTEYSDFIVTSQTWAIGTNGTLPNVIAQIDTSGAAEPYYVEFDMSFPSFVPQQTLEIKKQVMIDGFSAFNTYAPGAWQPGQYTVELRGSSIVTDDIMIDFQPGSEGSVLRGTSIMQTTLGASAINIAADDIEISGNLLGVGTSGVASYNTVSVYIDGARNTVIGGSQERDRNVFYAGSGDAIYITNNSVNDGTKIQGNWIGTNVNGSAANGTIGGSGIRIEGGDNIVIGGSDHASRNVIGNCQYGIEINTTGTKNYTVSGNYIGTDKNGTGSVGIQTNGIRVSGGQGINIGGSDMNVISESASYGIYLEGTATSNINIYNNYIGTDVTGSTSLSNGLYGIYITNNAHDNKIGYNGQGNLISGNGSAGIYIVQSDGNEITSNTFGLTAQGDTALPNNGGGISLFDCSNTIIGATGNGGNIISGHNGGNAISIYSSSGSFNNVIINNLIGVLADGESPMPNNGTGVFLDNEVDNTIIGGDADSSNVIANSLSGSGVQFSEMSGGFPEYNLVHNNSIYNNAFNGISFFGSVQQGVEIPVITLLQEDSTVQGTSAPNAYIQIFADSSNQGQILLGTTTADAAGNWSSTVSVPDLPWTTGYLTTLQDSAGNTSQFSEPVELCFAPLHVVNNKDDGSCGSLRKAIDYANNNSGPDTITFGIQNTTILPLTEYTIGGDTGTVIDASGKNITIKAGWSSADGIIQIFNVASFYTKIIGLNLDGEMDQSPGNYTNVGIYELGGASHCEFSDLNLEGFAAYAIVSSGDSSIISECTISNFGLYGIAAVTGINPRITNCTIGVNSSGQSFPGNQIIGIATTSNNAQIGGDIRTSGNTIINCDSIGIYVTNARVNIQGNYIGVDNSGVTAASNAYYGIYLDVADTSLVGGDEINYRNIISANNTAGILSNQTSNAEFKNNYFGLDASGENSVLGQSIGIRMQNGSISNFIAHNRLAHHDSAGVVFDGATTDSNSLYNNMIFNNDLEGIYLLNGANSGITPPVIDTVNGQTITGTAIPNSYVELFADDDHEGVYVLDTVTVDAAGNWTYTITGGQMQTMKFYRLDSITAIQTSDNGSSAFTSPYKVKLVGIPVAAVPHNAMSPDGDNINDHFIIDFLDQEEFQDNHLTILNKWGITVFEADNYQDQEPWDGTWNGKPVPDGTYYYILTTNYQYPFSTAKYSESGFIEIRTR